MTYRYIKNNRILHEDSGFSIPKDPKNIDYQKFLQWESAGNTAAPYAPSTEETAKELAASKLEADRAAAKQHARLQALAAMSPAEVIAWVEANVKTLPDAKDTIATLAVAVSILARQL